MILPGNVVAAAGNLLGFDTNEVVTGSTAATFFGEGFKFCVRYISRVAAQGSNDLSRGEALNILGAGLALLTVQHPRLEGWVATAQLGASDGVHAAYHGFTLGFPPGVNIWCDVEGIGAGTTAQQVTDYCNSWFDAVAAGGYVPGIYVGANAILDGNGLHALKFSHYWKSLSTVPQIPSRGYQMIQSNEHTVNGINIDENRTQNDQLSGTVMWLAPA